MDEFTGGCTYGFQCVGCHRGATWKCPNDNDTPPVYCSNSCRKRYLKAIKTALEGRIRRWCPRPDKIAYYTIADAQAGHRTRHPGKDGALLRPYQCRCGRFHVGRIKYTKLKENDDIPKGNE